MEEKLYVGTKIIAACPMNKFEFLSRYEGEEWTGPDREGYKVTYPGGFAAWSPKDVFEAAYREITSAEKEML